MARSLSQRRADGRSTALVAAAMVQNASIAAVTAEVVDQAVGEAVAGDLATGNTYLANKFADLNERLDALEGSGEGEP